MSVDMQTSSRPMDDGCPTYFAEWGKSNDPGKRPIAGQKSDDAKNPNAGFVYILLNPAMPGMLKIGRTRNSPDERARELSRPTGVALPFVVAWEQRFPHCEKAESQIHQRLEPYRVRKQREFFQLPLPDAIRELQLIAERESEAAVVPRLQIAKKRAEDTPSSNNFKTDPNHEILPLARKYFGAVQYTYFQGEIPQHKLANVKAKYSKLLRTGEAIIALYDGTYFGDAENGFILTSRGIGCAASNSEPHFVAYQSVRLSELGNKVGVRWLHIDSGKSAEVWSSQHNQIRDAFIDFIHDLLSR